MISGRSSTPLRRGAAEKSAAKNASPEGSDSGYGSTGNTTEGSMTGLSQEFANGVALPSRGIFERRITKLRPFDREIPQLTQHRFHDLHELFERPLCEYLTKAKVNPNAVSLKLKVLGGCEATAKPWIVVLCDKTESKKIKQFFNQPHIKAEYKPPNPDEFLPSFEVFVWNRPPRPMAGTVIYGDDDERSTTCGRFIRVGEAHQPRFATLGGLLKVINSNGIVTLYGMTAGHVLAQQPLEQDGNHPMDGHDAEEEEDEGFYSGEEDYELDDAFDCDEEARHLATNSKRMQTESQERPLGHCSSKIGSVFATSTEGTRTDHDLDWALIEFDRVTDYRPNLLAFRGSENAFVSDQSLRVNEKPTEDGTSRPVSLLSGMGGVKKGKLSTCLSFLMLGPAKAFTKTYTLILLDGSVLNAGDCGSWVVDPLTCEVYGHVVASDAMGDTYVVPLQSTLRDMEERLGAAVSLPTEADIHTWHKRQSQATTQQVAVPIARRKRFALDDSTINSAESSSETQKIAGHTSSQASTRLVSSAVKAPAANEDHNTLPNARIGGTSQDVGSNSHHHRRSSTRHHKNAVSETTNESLTGGHSKNAQYEAKEHMSAHQMGPIKRSIRSMFSGSSSKTLASDSQQRGNEKKKSVGYSEDGQNASFKTPSATRSPPTATNKHLRKGEQLGAQKDLASHPIGGKLPAPSKGLRVPPTQTVDPGPPVAIASPSLDGHRNIREKTISSSSRLAHPLAHGHDKIHKSSTDSRQRTKDDNPGQVSYEGYTFTKHDPFYNGHRADQKTSWAITRMVPMPVSQSDLKDQIYKNRKKQTSYNDEKMKGFKRTQVDNLVRERTKTDGDYGFEYVVASIKLDSRHTKGRTIETVSMQVILKRQLRAGLHLETPAGHSMGFHPNLSSRIMDVTGRDAPVEPGDYGRESQHRNHKDANVAPSIGPGVFPMSPASGQISGQGVQHVNKRPPPLPNGPDQPGLIYSPVPSMVPPPYPPYMVPAPHLPISLPPPPPNWIPPRPSGIANLQNENLKERGSIETVHKSNPQKKTPKIIDPRNKSYKRHDLEFDSSDSDSSLGLRSDESWARTEATPDTGFSGESRKSSKKKSPNKDEIVVKSSNHENVRPVYHASTRKEHRRSSLSPARRPRISSFDSFEGLIGEESHDWRVGSRRRPHETYHDDDEYYAIEPTISLPANRSSRPRGSSVSAERSHHHRASSYDLDRPVIHPSRTSIPSSRRPEVYQEALHPHSRTLDLERGPREWESDKYGESRDMDYYYERRDRVIESALEAETRRTRRLERRQSLELREERRAIERRDGTVDGRDRWHGTRAYDDYDIPRRRRLSDDSYY